MGPLDVLAWVGVGVVVLAVLVVVLVLVVAVIEGVRLGLRDDPASISWGDFDGDH